MNLIEKQKLLLAVGERIRRIRLTKDLTMKEIASQLHITVQAYGRIERGKSDIPISRLYLLAKLFDEPLIKIISEEQFVAIIRFEHAEKELARETAEVRHSVI